MSDAFGRVRKSDDTIDRFEQLTVVIVSYRKQILRSIVLQLDSESRVDVFSWVNVVDHSSRG